MSDPKVLLEQIIIEYREKYLQKNKVYEDTLSGEVQRVRDALLDEKFNPSLQLKNILNKQIKRAVYPMEVAIVGQFSSGKSTFLNALLSKDILPTGITPVTSKVIYINYGEVRKLKVTYKSGVHEYHPLEEIAKFSDQRLGTRNEIKYLSIYAPVEILKEISFVDTPGLNSQSQEDTKSSRKVLQDVGGIIWLSLLDNAGKRSEQEILDSYMSAFKGKTLCILNQKDKFDETQIAQTTAYIQEKFSDYFSKVIAISAKMALQGRSLEPSVLIDQSMNGLINTFRKQLEAHPHCDSLSFFSEHFESFKDEVEQIRSLDISKVEAEVEASNIQEVIDYIEVEMRPNANDLKAFRIQNDLKNICDILLNAYHTMTSVYDALDGILESATQKSIEDLDVSKKHFGMMLSQLYHDIETNFQKISMVIYENIKPSETYDYQSPSSFLHMQKIEKHVYETFRVDSNASMNTLFYNDALVESMNQEVFSMLKRFETETAKALEEIYVTFEAGVLSWQHKYLLLSKNREISSDLEFSKVKRFASKVHENILNPFHLCFVHQIEAVHTQSAYIRGALSYNYMQTVQVTLWEVQEKIEESELTHKQDPGKFAIHKPSQEEIFKRLKMNFSFEILEANLSTDTHFFSKVVQKAKKDLLTILEEKKSFIAQEKVPFTQKMFALEKIKTSIQFSSQ